MIENSNIDSHKTIFKSTGIFGFVQVMKIIIGIAGSKLVAIFLGPIGIGTLGLLNNTIGIITSLTSFGIATTSVREIAESSASHDGKKISEAVFIIKKVSIIIGFFGAIISVLCCKLLSQWTFGTTQYYYWFIILAIHFIITSYNIVQSSVLQGLRLMKAVAFSNVLSSFFIVLVSIPIYYFLKLDGILYVVISSGIISFLVNYFFFRKIEVVKIELSFQEIKTRLKPLIKLGFLLSINVIFGQICTFLIKLYLRHNGESASILGYYEVSTVILISYVGMVFSAMSMDFFPKLTMFNKDNAKMITLINNQLEIALLLVTPAILVLYLIAPFVLEILYTKDFLQVILIFKAALFAVIIKTICWPFAFIILAKADKKQYFIQELFSDFLNVSLTILFFNYFGLIGIGLANVLNFGIYGIYVYFIVVKKHAFKLRKDCFIIIFCSTLFGLLSCITMFSVPATYMNYCLALLAILSILYSLYQLDKRIDLRGYLIIMKGKLFNR